ncbi:MAG: biotin transporter BioY [Firmicutes bacterium]|mgnify:CR=1 FL=1|nr:biotin transporter BioY [Bacillota bacterium]
MRKTALREYVAGALFAALTALLAYVAIPLPGGLPPVTGQSLAVMLSGLLLGARGGATSQLVYLLLGVSGLPVFAGGKSGLQVLAGPTGGFIWGFVLGAYLTGRLTENHKQPSVLRLLGAAFAGGICAVYVPGIIQLAWLLKLSPGKALLAMLPYLPGDLLKAAVSVFLAAKAGPAVRRGRQ